MTERNLQDEKDQALGRYVRLKQAAADAVTEVNEIASQIELFADQFRIDPRELALESYPWLNPNGVKAAIATLDKAEHEVEEAAAKALALGVII